MYRTGHYGISLLLYAPVLAALLVIGRSSAALAGLLGVLALARVPDWDHRIPGVTHRGSTHTLAFAWLVGALFAAAALSLPGVAPGARIPLAALALFVGTYGITAHLVADALTPSGVALFWPLTANRYSLSLTTASNRLANALLLALGVFATAVAVALPLQF